jgi:exodeoxyribonuclease V alpha subunit
MTMILSTPRPFYPHDKTKREHTGMLDGIKWSDAATGFVIAVLRDGATVKGKVDIAGFTRGMIYRFLGRWMDDKKYGPQFRFDTYIELTPAGKVGILKYLTKLCDGIGEKSAERLWSKYGSDAVKILREDPNQVVADGMLSREIATLAAEELEKASALEGTKIDLFDLFAGRGFPADSLIHRCVCVWGARAPAVIRRDPFTLMVRELPGCGFKRCDKLYVELGKNPTRLKRQMLACWHSIRFAGNGHTWYPVEHAVRHVRENIGVGADPVRAVKLGIRSKWLRHRRDHINKLWIAESDKAHNEQTIADGIARLMHNRNICMWPDVSVGRLSEHQANAIAAITKRPVGILCGSPGTGKTFAAAAVIRHVVAAHGEESVALAAPTGKAAVRLTQAVQQYDLPLYATTIHRMLRLGQAWSVKGQQSEFGPSNPLPFRFVFIDESSMLDTDLAAALIRALPAGCHLFLIGDPYQLPPVGHGSPLRDLLNTKVPSTELTEIRRNAGMIVHACANIKNGQPFKTSDKYDPDNGLNLRMIERSSPAESLEMLFAILDRFKQTHTFCPVWQTQVLVGVNEKGSLCRRNVNNSLQMLLNPDGGQIHGNPFRVGDKVICLKNCALPGVTLNEELLDEEKGITAANAAAYRNVGSEIYTANGEIGRVLAIGPNVMIARFSESDNIIRIPIGKQKDAEDDSEGKKDEDRAADKGRGCNFDLGYAISVHKSQGSEAPCVIVLIDENAQRIASREFHYTAISRASQLCILIGQRTTIERQAKRVALKKRKTFLKELTQAALAAMDTGTDSH